LASLAAASHLNRPSRATGATTVALGRTTQTGGHPALGEISEPGCRIGAVALSRIIETAGLGIPPPSAVD
jgi:hypothetical protein